MADKHTVALSSSVEHAPDSSPEYSRTDIGPAQGEQKTSTGTTQGLNLHKYPSTAIPIHRPHTQTHQCSTAIVISNTYTTWPTHPRAAHLTPPPEISSRHRTRPHLCITALSRASSSSSFTPRLTMTARPSAVSRASWTHHVSCFLP